MAACVRERVRVSERGERERERERYYMCAVPSYCAYWTSKRILNI